MNDEYQDLVSAKVPQEPPMTERMQATHAQMRQGMASVGAPNNQIAGNSPIDAALAQLDHVVSMAEDKLSRLESRLAPMCSQMAPEEPPAQRMDSGGSSVVIGSITGSTDRLVNILIRLDRLDSVLEL
jgi:hypothetical protein